MDGSVIVLLEFLEFYLLICAVRYQQCFHFQIISQLIYQNCLDLDVAIYKNRPQVTT
jgi:hypothetical protein